MVFVVVYFARTKMKKISTTTYIMADCCVSFYREIRTTMNEIRILESKKKEIYVEALSLPPKTNLR